MLSLLHRLYKSIALLPMVIALCFLLFSFLLNFVEIDYSSWSVFNGLSIEDKDDVQTIFSFVIGGIFTLTIFSYTMVMNVLNRSINNYSPRLIPLILSERHHQLILGFTSGTILYAMVMSIFLNNINSDYFPSIAAGLSIIFSIVCVLLFIYFIHSVSQSIHVNHILKSVYEKTKGSIENEEKQLEFLSHKTVPDLEYVWTNINGCGYLHTYDLEQINEFAVKHDVIISILKFEGDFILENEELIKTSKELKEDTAKKLMELLPLDHTVVSDLIETGFKHLVEVAVKASSPAINDPGTAVNSIHYLTQLFIKKLKLGNHNSFSKENSIIYFNDIKVEDLYLWSFTEMYHYMNEDPALKEVLFKSMIVIEQEFQDLKSLRHLITTD